MVDRRVVEALIRPMKFEERAGPGKIKYKYVKGEDVIERLNEAFIHEWSSEVISEIVNDDFIVLRIRLSVFLPEIGKVYKEAYGGASIIKNKHTGAVVDLANGYKSAFTNALKKAAEQFGVGLKEEVVSTKTFTTKHSNEKEYSNSKVENTATGTTTVKISNPEVTVSSALDEAKKMMEDLERKSTKQDPTKQEPDKGSQSNHFPKPTTNSSDTATDLQRGAITKLAETSNFSEPEIIKAASNDKNLTEKLGPGLSGKTKVEELTKTEAAAIIRFISSKNMEN